MLHLHPGLLKTRKPLMKRLCSIGLRICLMFTVVWSVVVVAPAIAAPSQIDPLPEAGAIAPSPPSSVKLNNGKILFQQNCAVCHINGQNLIITHKTLDYDALKTYRMNSIEAITRQVTYGKNVMPAFGESLSSDQINDIATYVLHQAQQGW